MSNRKIGVGSILGPYVITRLIELAPACPPDLCRLVDRLLAKTEKNDQFLPQRSRMNCIVFWPKLPLPNCPMYIRILVIFEPLKTRLNH